VSVYLRHQADFPSARIYLFQQLPTGSTLRLKGALYPPCNLTGSPWSIKATQITTVVRCHVAPCFKGGHFAVAYHQHITSAHSRYCRFVSWDVQRVVSTVAGHCLAAKGQPQRVEGGKHDFELSKIRAIVLAVASLQQTALFSGIEIMIDGDAGRVEANSVSWQTVEADPTMGEGGVKDRLGRGRAKHGENVG
jgi:hypothetical protein